MWLMCYNCGFITLLHNFAQVVWPKKICESIMYMLVPRLNNKSGWLTFVCIVNCVDFVSDVP